MTGTGNSLVQNRLAISTEDISYLLNTYSPSGSATIRNSLIVCATAYLYTVDLHVIIDLHALYAMSS